MSSLLVRRRPLKSDLRLDPFPFRLPPHAPTPGPRVRLPLYRWTIYTGLDHDRPILTRLTPSLVLEGPPWNLLLLVLLHHYARA